MTLKLIRSAALGSLAMPAILRAPLLFTGPQANILTNLLPSLWAGLDIVSRELVGMIPSVTLSADVSRAAINQPVYFPVAPRMETHDNTPAMSVPEPEDHEGGTGSVMITKSKNANFGFVGEEQLALDSGSGPGVNVIQAGWFAQALRTLVNEVERDLFTAAYVAASRATGTAGTTPFASGVGDSAQLAKILDDNGAPTFGRSSVVNTSTGAQLRTNTQLTKANEAGSTLTLRQGELLDLNGISFKQSGQAVNHVKGTGSAYTSTAAGFPVGTTEIPLITGTGTVKPGDIVTFAGDPNKYVVAKGVAAPGTISIGAPGLMQALPAVATAMTIGNNYAANIAFTQDAIILAARPPAMPKEGDLAADSFLMVDPRSGIAFDVRVYLGYGKVRYQVGLAWGWGVPNPEHVAALLG